MLWEASVLDPIEVDVFCFVREEILTHAKRVSDSTVYLSRTAKRFFRQLQEEKKSFQRVCFGFSSRGRFLPRNRLLACQKNWPRGERYRNLSRTLLIRRVFVRLFGLYLSLITLLDSLEPYIP